VRQLDEPASGLIDSYAITPEAVAAIDPARSAHRVGVTVERRLGLRPTGCALPPHSNSDLDFYVGITIHERDRRYMAPLASPRTHGVRHVAIAWRYADPVRQPT